MKYKEHERQKAIATRDIIFRDPGQGKYYGIPRDFVLANPNLNLWEGIREDILEYFKKNRISWHKGENNGPTGHLLSSQIACLNHLYFIRQRKDVATAILRNIRADIEEAVIVDDGFVEFEFIGSKRYMKERAWSRGVNCTSVDAVMIGKNQAGKKIMFLIEWKYTEEYHIENKYIPERASVYDSLIQNPNSPFMKPSNIEVMYYEPFYQLMRQTLLGWQCIINDDHNCSDYFHLHVIPKGNTEVRNRITSPGCSGKDISEAWKKMLKDPNKYQSIDPADLLKPCLSMIDCKSILTYLQNRYW